MSHFFHKFPKNPFRSKIYTKYFTYLNCLSFVVCHSLSLRPLTLDRSLSSSLFCESISHLLHSTSISLYSAEMSTENHLKTVGLRILLLCFHKAILIQAGETLEFQNKLEVTNKISPQCSERFQELKLRRRHRYIIYKLGESEVEGKQLSHCST